MAGNPGTRERATEARGHVHNKRRRLGEVPIITAKIGTSPKRHPAGALLTTSGARPKAALACGYIKSGGSAAIGAHGSAALATQPLTFNNLLSLCGSARAFPRMVWANNAKKRRAYAAGRSFVTRTGFKPVTF